MKNNLLYSLLPLSLVSKIKAVQKKQSYLLKNTPAINEGMNVESRSLSNIQKNLKDISVIADHVHVNNLNEVPSRKNKIKILLVDDNKTNQVLISSLLKKEKYQFDIVKNGWEAICAFEANTYDLIVMDINMPVLDGEEATMAIRKTNKQIPILALTADDLCTELFEDKLYMGFNDVISTPFDDQVFIATINNLIALTKRTFPFTSSINNVTLAS